MRMIPNEFMYKKGFPVKAESKEYNKYNIPCHLNAMIIIIRLIPKTEI